MTQDKILRKLLDGLDRISIIGLAVAAGSTVFFFALLFWLGSFYSWGLKISPGQHVGVFDALYFSVVTFTSLGYGDFVPVGLSRLFCCLEVCSGLAFFGIGVAKLSSFKQSYLLGQLYARDVQYRLDEHAVTLRKLRNSCKDVTSSIQANKRPNQTPSFLVEQAKVELMRIRGYVSFESRHGYLLAETPAGSNTRLLKAGSALTEKITSMVCQRRSQASQRVRTKALKLLILINEISGYYQNSGDESIDYETQRLNAICKKSTSKINEFFRTSPRRIGEP